MGWLQRSLSVASPISRSAPSFRVNWARRFSRTSAGKAFSDFDALRATSKRLSRSTRDFALADRLVRDYPTKLSAPDALHLASAKNAAASLASSVASEAEAARAQGVEVAALG